MRGGFLFGESMSRASATISRSSEIDNFAMRNFTNDAVFDDTFPAGDGLLEVGHRVPLDRLRTAMDDWFRRKGYLKKDDQLEIVENG